MPDCDTRCLVECDKRSHASRWIRQPGACRVLSFPLAKEKTGSDVMAKFDLDSLSIEELAALRENATAKLFEKVAARQAELEAELEKLSQYGKPAKKPVAAPAARSGKAEEKAEKASEQAKEAVAKAA